MAPEKRHSRQLAHNPDGPIIFRMQSGPWRSGFPLNEGTAEWANSMLLTYTKPLLARLMLPHGRLISLAVTAVVSLLLLTVPVYSSGQTLVKVNGPRVFGILAIPIVIALGPLVFPRLKIPAAIAMLVFALLGGFSIGLFYLPAAMVLFWPERR